MVMQERPDAPRDSHILIRGVWDKPGEKVTRGVPAQLLAPAENLPDNRLGLAQWLVDPAHPLTARVAVNRYWQVFLGTGLVKTTEDFGAQGERPSHPELLDWLAAEFVASGWDVKSMHRLIVTSAAYRQTSRVTPALVERDPANRLLSRGPRYRLSSAMIRDQALAASGLLVERLGGPPVKPYQPPGVWEEMSFGGIKYEQDHGDKLYRRSLYTFWRRTIAPTMLFDAASRQVCTLRLARTNTPLQALSTLNDVTYVEAARVLAERVVSSELKSPEERVTRAFRLLTSRRPSAAELSVLIASIARLQQQYADRDAAQKLLRAGETKPNEQLDASEVAAYTSQVLMLMNLDETLTKE
jgi:hypothetical protein